MRACQAMADAGADQRSRQPSHGRRSPGLRVTSSTRAVTTQIHPEKERVCGGGPENPEFDAVPSAVADAALSSRVAVTAMSRPLSQLRRQQHRQHQRVSGPRRASRRQRRRGSQSLRPADQSSGRVFDKTGALTAPFTLSSLFARSAGICARTRGDPIVLYDNLSDRWISELSSLLRRFDAPLPRVRRGLQDGRSDRRVLRVRLRHCRQRVPRLPQAWLLARRLLHDDQPVLQRRTFDGTGVFAFDRAKMLAGDPTAGESTST